MPLDNLTQNEIDEQKTEEQESIVDYQSVLNPFDQASVNPLDASYEVESATQSFQEEDKWVVELTADLYSDVGAFLGQKITYTKYFTDTDPGSTPPEELIHLRTVEFLDLDGFEVYADHLVFDDQGDYLSGAASSLTVTTWDPNPNGTWDKTLEQGDTSSTYRQFQTYSGHPDDPATGVLYGESVYWEPANGILNIDTEEYVDDVLSNAPLFFQLQSADEMPGRVARTVELLGVTDDNGEPNVDNATIDFQNIFVMSDTDDLFDYTFNANGNGQHVV